MAVENVAGTLRQADALELALTRRIEQAKFDGVGVMGKHRDIDAITIERRAERFRRAGRKAARRHRERAAMRSR
jgi:hypothetical protein